MIVICPWDECNGKQSKGFLGVSTRSPWGYKPRWGYKPTVASADAEVVELVDLYYRTALLQLSDIENRFFRRASSTAGRK